MCCAVAHYMYVTDYPTVNMCIINDDELLIKYNTNVLYY